MIVESRRLNNSRSTLSNNLGVATKYTSIPLKVSVSKSIVIVSNDFNSSNSISSYNPGAAIAANIFLFPVFIIFPFVILILFISVSLIVPARAIVYGVCIL